MYSADPSGGFPFIFFAFVAIAVLAAYLNYQNGLKRHRENAAWAQARGWNYIERDQNLVNFSTGQPFGTGYSRKATEVFSGQHRGWHVLSFNYQWTVKQGKSSTTYHRHIIGIYLGMALPKLDIAPDSSVQRMLGGLAGQDIDFESAEFNKQWRTSCRDLRFAHDVVHPRMMELLLTDAYLGRTYRYENMYLMSWLNGRQRREYIFSMADLLINKVALLPTYLTDTDR